MRLTDDAKSCLKRFSVDQRVTMTGLLEAFALSLDDLPAEDRERLVQRAGAIDGNNRDR